MDKEKQSTGGHLAYVSMSFSLEFHHSTMRHRRRSLRISLVEVSFCSMKKIILTNFNFLVHRHRLAERRRGSVTRGCWCCWGDAHNRSRFASRTWRLQAHAILSFDQFPKHHVCWATVHPKRWWSPRYGLFHCQKSNATTENVQLRHGPNLNFQFYLMYRNSEFLVTKTP